jgi:hypothetical protein
MKEGLLWFDDDKGSDLAQKVGRAAACYRQKHGHGPTVCFVHPSLLDEHAPTYANGVRIEGLPIILIHHFWIGEGCDGD